MYLDPQHCLTETLTPWSQNYFKYFFNFKIIVKCLQTLKVGTSKAKGTITHKIEDKNLLFRGLTTVERGNSSHLFDFDMKLKL